jgi:hypothetical protein
MLRSLIHVYYRYRLRPLRLEENVQIGHCVAYRAHSTGTSSQIMLAVINPFRHAINKK